MEQEDCMRCPDSAMTQKAETAWQAAEAICSQIKRDEPYMCAALQASLWNGVLVPAAACSTYVLDHR